MPKGAIAAIADNGRKENLLEDCYGRSKQRVAETQCPLKSGRRNAPGKCENQAENNKLN
jgi:hypothetical protein